MLADKIGRWALSAVGSWLVVAACFLTRAIIGWSPATQADPFPTIFFWLLIVSFVATVAAVFSTYWSVLLWWRGRVSDRRD